MQINEIEKLVDGALSLVEDAVSKMAKVNEKKENRWNGSIEVQNKLIEARKDLRVIACAIGTQACILR